jgi:predicted CXXCH cytochrome family protein
MKQKRAERRLRAWRATVLAVMVCGVTPGVFAQNVEDLAHTKHNLSVSGPGSVRALTETRTCVFCHTPHNASPLSPLWNKALDAQVYSVYTSPTLKAGPLPQPAGPTKLCLSCHDGTIATGTIVSPAGNIAMAGSGLLPAGSPSNFGVDLGAHHPVSFPYGSALPNAGLASSPPPELHYGAKDEVHCTTCHDPHQDPFGAFLRKDNRYAALCTTCHQVAGWAGSKHATSTASVAGVLPRPPKTTPAWTQMNEWGCAVCHTSHFAPTAESLLSFTSSPPSPYSCTTIGCHGGAAPPAHGANLGTARLGGGGGVDIGRQAQKPSAHREPREGGSRTGSLGGAARSGACVSCHNPHRTNDRPAEPPVASGRLDGVSGLDRNGARLAQARYEYEVCFKCHADHTPDVEYVPRVVSSTNVRADFDPGNPSYHPVVSVGRTLDVPSLPSSREPAMSATSMLYCTSCHADDEGGTRGPHGSSFAPILKERYETADGTPESYDNYALCYRCHDRASILGDASFRAKTLRTTPSGGGHSGHLLAGASCATCHDPHGVPAGAARGTGSHTRLINFDRRVVLPKAGDSYPIFNATGPLSGNCTLSCHGVTHDRTSYP